VVAVFIRPVDPLTKAYAEYGKIAMYLARFIAFFAFL
jgi:hypothetical protein